MEIGRSFGGTSETRIQIYKSLTTCKFEFQTLIEPVMLTKREKLIWQIKVLRVVRNGKDSKGLGRYHRQNTKNSKSNPVKSGSPNVITFLPLLSGRLKHLRCYNFN